MQSQSQKFSKSAVMLILSALVFAGALILAQQPHARHEPLTISSKHVTYDENGDGTVLVNEVGTYTLRADGSYAYEWVIATRDGEVGRGRLIQDHQARQETVMMFDLGVMLSRAIPETGVHNQHNAVNNCRSLAEKFGTQEGDNPLSRRHVSDDGSTVLRRYFPEAGCQVLESSRTSPDGKIRSRRTVLDSKPETAEALFEIDPSLEHVTMKGLADAHQRRYGRPLAAADVMRGLGNR